MNRHDLTLSEMTSMVGTEVGVSAWHRIRSDTFRDDVHGRHRGRRVRLAQD